MARRFDLRPKHVLRLPNVLVVRQEDMKRLSSYVGAGKLMLRAYPRLYIVCVGKAAVRRGIEAARRIGRISMYCVGEKRGVHSWAVIVVEGG